MENNEKKKSPGITTGNEPIDLDGFSDNAIVRIHLRGETQQTNGKMVEMTVGKLRKLLDEKFILSRNNTLFLKHEVKLGVIAQWCKYFYEYRKSVKKEMGKVSKQIYEKKYANEEEKKQLEDKVKSLHDLQLSVKLQLNSVYGILGTPYSAIYNPDIAQSITRNGKFCNINSSKFITKRFKEMFGTTDEYPALCGGDTDSLFVNVKCFSDDMKAKNPSLPEQLMKWDDKSKFELWEKVSNFVDNEVVPFVQNLVREKCHTNHPEMLRYGLEYIADTAFYEKQKHYAVHKMIGEGPELVDKISFMGIELKKATQPIKVKEFLAEIYTKTMTDDSWNETKFKELITICYNKFKKLGVDDIASWKGYKSARESEGFLEMALGATGISKGCTYYNQMLDKLGIGKKYDKINLGDKVRFTYINPNNQYKINCMAFPASTGWPAEFNGIFVPDYNKMFEGVMSAIKSYMEAIGFRKIDPRKTDMQNLDDL